MESFPWKQLLFLRSLLLSIVIVLRQVEQAFTSKIKLENRVIVKQVFQVEDLLLTRQLVRMLTVTMLKSSWGTTSNYWVFIVLEVKVTNQ